MSDLKEVNRLRELQEEVAAEKGLNPDALLKIVKDDAKFPQLVNA